MLEHRWRWADGPAEVITDLGGPGPAFAAGLVVALLAWRRRPAAGLAVLLLTLARPLLSAAAKQAVGRDRPGVGALVDAAGHAYPSGHTLAAAVLAGSIALAAAGTRWSGAVLAGAVAATAAVGATRVQLGVHWLSDVVGGAALGAAMVCAASAAVQRGLLDRLAQAGRRQPGRR